MHQAILFAKVQLGFTVSIAVQKGAAGAAGIPSCIDGTDNDTANAKAATDAGKLIMTSPFTGTIPFSGCYSLAFI